MKEFNTYLINIRRTLSDQIHLTHSSLDYLPQDKKTTSSFVFNPVSKECIADVITKLKSKSSYGYDNISNKLTSIVNQCLHTGIYPSQLKSSCVKPLFKSGDKSKFNNYKPISLLPSLSKIF